MSVVDQPPEADRQTPPPEAVDKSEHRIQRMFGQIAGRYDLLNHLLSLNIDRYWRRRAVKAAPPQTDAPILDLCTGTGDLALAYFKAGRKTVPVVAADFCHEMLVIGRKKGQRVGGQDRLVFVEADAQRLPFPNERFQIVSVAFGLRNVTDTERGLAEMVRVLAPGGRLVVLEFSMPSRQPLRGLYRWYFRRVLPGIGQLLARNRESAYSYLPASVEQFPSGEALAEKMRAAGLSEVTFRPMTFGIATLYIGRK